MKRIVSFMLVLCMMLSFIPASVAANSNDTQLKALPEVGTVISGFKTKEIGNMELINSKTVLFEHEKTGAELLFVQSKDIDRSFDITFKTPAIDDTGVNHILEHITISGSKKYPLKDVMFTAANQTYSTYVNAMTSQTWTTYPIASMSEAQLMKLADLYLDCVYNPLVYSDKNIFAREAWRYELADEKSPLTVTGVVYNEMKAGNINEAAMRNVLKTLYPNSAQSYSSVGDPDVMTELTYDQLINYHKTYYHPSNSLMVLYGNVDYEKFLKHINDEYLSKYDKKDIKIDTGKVAPAKEKVEKTYQFPVSAKSNTKSASEIDYAFVLNDITDEEITGLELVCAYLNQPASPLQKAFNESKIGGSLYAQVINISTQPILSFTAINADENRKEDFRKLIDSTIGDILKKGIDKAAIDAIVSATMLSNANITESRNLGVGLSVAISQKWVISGETDYISVYYKTLKGLGANLKDNYLENLTAKYVLKNNHGALVTTVPQAGLAEKKEQELKKKLADIKASMSKEEIAKTVADTKAYSLWNSRTDDEKVIESLKGVSITDLPEEVKKYKVNEAKLSDGIRILSSEANVGETALSTIYLDTSSVPVEKLHYLKLFSSILGGLETKNYNHQQLNTQVMRYLSGASFGITTIGKKDKSFTPYMAISWIGLIGEYDKQLDLVKELLLNTNFDNKTELLNIVKTQKSNFKASVTNEPLGVLMDRSTAHFSDSSNYNTYIFGLDYYNFLVKLEKNLEERPEEVIGELKSIKEMVVNKTNMIATFAGNKNNISKFEAAINSVIDALPAKNIVKQDYSKLPKPLVKEAIVMDTSVQYNMVSATYEEMGATFSGKYLPISLIIEDNYILPKIRFGYGAYGGMVNFGASGLIITSYRDPNIKETYDVYNGLADYVKNANLTQKDLERYILKTYSQYTYPSGELSGASNAIVNYLSGKTDEEKLQLLHEIKSLTVEDVKASAKLFENLMKKGTYSTVGDSRKVNENKELFENNILTFDVGTASNETITRAQLFEIILAGLPNALDTAKQMGLLTADSMGNYRENEKLKREELAAIIVKVMQLNGKELTGKEVDISDLDKAGRWAKDVIKAVVYSGVMKLDDKGNFNPKGEITSAEVQAIVVELQAKLTAK